MRRTSGGVLAGPAARRGIPQILTTSLVVCGMLLSGCSVTGSPGQPARATATLPSSIGSDAPAAAPAPGNSLVATAVGTSVRVHRSPGGAPGRTLVSPIASGGPLTFLVTDEQDTWLKVQLPTRPNGSTGWISRDDVQISTTPYRLVVSMERHRLEVFKNGVPVQRHQVGVGTAATPTPPGEYYLTELIRPEDPDGVYGPYAFGISGHSDTLQQFAGGPGQLGLHGTNQPGKLGTDVSHGCLRLANEVITDLAETLPLGTPIEIRA